MAITLDALKIDATTGQIWGVETGDGVISNGRDSDSYVLDHEGVWRQVEAYENRYKNSRIVKNLITLSSEDLQAAAWTTAGSVTIDNATEATWSAVGTGNRLQNADTFVGIGALPILRLKLTAASGTPTIRVQIRQGGTNRAIVDIPISTTEEIYSVPVATAFSALTACTVWLTQINGTPQTITIKEVQIEDATGRTDTTTPSEYASVGTGTHPGQLGVDGVIAYGTENGNSVVSNVVTEAVGTALSPVPTLIQSPALTNSQIRSNDLADAEWTGSNMTVGDQDETGIDGYPNTACTLTASAGNATLIANAITASSDDQTTRWFIKRKTGTGNIDLTVDNGATWTTVTTSASFEPLIVSQAAVTNPQIGIRIVTSADAVIVGNAGCYTAKTEVEVRGSPPIFTTTAAVSITADDYTLDLTNHSNTQGTYACTWTPSYATSEVSGDLELISLTTAAGLLYYDGTNGDVESTDGTNTSTKAETIVADTAYDLEVAYNGGLQVSVDAVAGSAESYDGAFTTGTEIVLFRNAASTNELWGLTFDDGSTGTNIPVVMHHYMHNIG